jgi:hypothetical protein
MLLPVVYLAVWNGGHDGPHNLFADRECNCFGCSSASPSSLAAWTERLCGSGLGTGASSCRVHLGRPRRHRLTPSVRTVPVDHQPPRTDRPVSPVMPSCQALARCSYVTSGGKPWTVLLSRCRRVGMPRACPNSTSEAAVNNGQCMRQCLYPPCPAPRGANCRKQSLLTAPRAWPLAGSVGGHSTPALDPGCWLAATLACGPRCPHGACACCCCCGGGSGAAI